jgi:chloramphenicol 3-O phosphotransferase
MDVFVDMLPARILGHPDGMTFETKQEGDSPSVVIKSGPVMERTMHGMRHAIAALAAQGNDLVVDDVMMQEARPTIIGHF